MHHHVAILIPVYNNQNGLIKTLNSIEYDFPLTIVVIDDGSQEAIQICTENYQPHQIYIYRLKRNKGVEHARRLGTKLLKSFKYIAFIDAGDEAINHRFKVQFDYLESHNTIDCVGSWVNMIDENNKKIEYIVKTPENSDTIKQQIYAKCCLFNPSIMLRTTAIFDVGGYRETYACAEDFDFLIRFIETHQCSNVQQVLLNYEINPNSVTSKRRDTQITSSLQILWQHPKYTNIYWWLGVAKLYALKLFSRNKIHILKKYVFKT